MSHQDGRCDECTSRNPQFAFHGVIGKAQLMLCRRCAGVAAQMLLRYIRGHDKEHAPKRPPPANPAFPRRDSFHQARCRECEIKLLGWKMGDSPYCVPCLARKATEASL
jgi:hypothetical protein